MGALCSHAFYFVSYAPPPFPPSTPGLAGQASHRSANDQSGEGLWTLRGGGCGAVSRAATLHSKEEDEAPRTRIRLPAMANVCLKLLLTPSLPHPTPPHYHTGGFGGGAHLLSFGLKRKGRPPRHELRRKGKGASSPFSSLLACVPRASTFPLRPRNVGSAHAP
jgi:hypothetical protein